ncbi:MAG: Carboxymethylenebutenolidase, partial [Pseudomonadota bacterium]
MGTFIQLTAADGTQFPAYVAEPATPAKAAVVVIQEIFGVNVHIREVADAYAKEGYLAIAPAMFHRAQANVELGYAEADMGAGMALKTAIEALPAPGALQDIQASIDHAHKVCGGKV